MALTGTPPLSRADAILAAGVELLAEYGDPGQLREAIREANDAADEVDAKSLARRERSRSEDASYWRTALPGLAEAELAEATATREKREQPYWQQGAAGAALAEALAAPPPDEKWKAHAVATMAAELGLRDDDVDIPALAREGAAAAAYLAPMNIHSDGALHRDLGVPEGQALPADRIAGLAKQPGDAGSRARLAQRLLDQARRSTHR